MDPRDQLLRLLYDIIHEPAPEDLSSDDATLRDLVRFDRMVEALQQANLNPGGK